MCSHHFIKYLKDNPLPLDTRDELVQYFCKMHNVLNNYLKKPLFNCSKIYDKYGGYCGCKEENFLDLTNSFQKSNRNEL